MHQVVLTAAVIVAIAWAVARTAAVGQVPGPAAPSVALPDIEERLALSRDATKRYADRLRQELKAALAAGGPRAAIGACTTIGPDLDNTISEAMGLEVFRTAAKVRNPDNAPDPWESAGLDRFAKDIAAGADPAKLERYELTKSSEGQKLFRYMKPIMMQETCLACHGPRIEPDIKAEIARTYPEDKAVGFNVGELRGAFSIIQQID
jgi:mono/diheme cytochrome c family protein